MNYEAGRVMNVSCSKLFFVFVFPATCMCHCVYFTDICATVFISTQRRLCDCSATGCDSTQFR